LKCGLVILRLMHRSRLGCNWLR